jgi:hypothetical protein
MVKKPPHILITTPESLYLYLTAEQGLASRSWGCARSSSTKSTRWLSDKRGSHFALVDGAPEGVDRQRKDPTAKLQCIGLSATTRPLERARAVPRPAAPRDERPPCASVQVGHVRAWELSRRDARRRADSAVPTQRDVGAAVRAACGAVGAAPHHVGLHQHPPPRRACRARSGRASGPGRRRRSPRQHVARAAATGRRPAQGGHAEGDGGDRQPRAGHRHRVDRPGGAAGLAAQHRSDVAAPGPQRAPQGRGVEGPASGDLARRAGRMRGAAAGHQRAHPRRGAVAEQAARCAGPAVGRRGGRARLAGRRAVRAGAPRDAVRGIDSKRVRPGAAPGLGGRGHEQGPVAGAPAP